MKTQQTDWVQCRNSASWSCNSHTSSVPQVSAVLIGFANRETLCYRISICLCSCELFLNLSSSNFLLLVVAPAFWLGRSTLVGKGLTFNRELSLFAFLLYLSIHRTQQLRSGLPSNVFWKFGRR